MRIVEEAPELVRLRFDHTLLGLLVTIVGLLVSWLMLDTCTIHLSRDGQGTVNCRVENARIGHKRVRLVPNVEEAVIQKIKPSDQEGNPTYRAVLISSGGQLRHPVTSYSTGDSTTSSEIADAVNLFIQDKHAVDLHHTIGWGYGGLMLLVPVLGVLIILGFRGECTIDNRQVLVTRWRPWGTQRLAIPLDQVQSFRMLKREKLQAPGILCTDGRQIVFSEIWSSKYSFRKQGVLERLNARLAQTRRAASSVGPLAPHLQNFAQHPSRINETRSSLPKLAPIRISGLKLCAICGLDCSEGERWRDDHGRYYHPHCHTSRFAADDLKEPS